MAVSYSHCRKKERENTAGPENLLPFPSSSGETEEIPEHLISLAELVLDQDNQLVEEKRLPGENNVSLRSSSALFLALLTWR